VRREHTHRTLTHTLRARTHARSLALPQRTDASA
jgi:hypothetical protein